MASDDATCKPSQAWDPAIVRRRTPDSSPTLGEPLIDAAAADRRRARARCRLRRRRLDGEARPAPAACVVGDRCQRGAGARRPRSRPRGAWSAASRICRLSASLRRRVQQRRSALGSRSARGAVSASAARFGRTDGSWPSSADSAACSRIRQALHAALAATGARSRRRMIRGLCRATEEYAALAARATASSSNRWCSFRGRRRCQGEMADWLRTFAQPFLAPIAESDARRVPARA